MHSPFSSFVLLLCVIVVLTNVNTVQPTTADPSIAPSTAIPTSPTADPSTIAPTISPSTIAPSTTIPTSPPTISPSTIAPSTTIPTSPPTISPSTIAPSTTIPTSPPTISPSTIAPSAEPSTAAPSSDPSTTAPTISPSTIAPSFNPSTAAPSFDPSTVSPSIAPSANPSTTIPTSSPSTTNPSTSSPTADPSTTIPTADPSTAIPTSSPSTTSPSTIAPTADPSTTAPTTTSPSTIAPTAYPTTTNPSTISPTSYPPTSSPSTTNPSTAIPTSSPSTANPSSASPTADPSTTIPTSSPSTTSPSTIAPTADPSTIAPSANPSTIAPSSFPTFAPTASPSTVPVGTNGYVYQQFYTASDCGGSKSFVEGYFANYCYSTGSYYRKYNFTKDDCSDLVELLYDDSSCSSFTSSTALTNFSSCTNNEGSVPAGSSLKGFCSLEPMIPITMDCFMESSYMDSACSTSAVSYFLYATDLCVDLTLDEAEPSSEYSTCSSYYNNITTKAYSDQGQCILSDLSSVVVQPTYSCQQTGGAFYVSLSCQQIAPQGTDGYLYEQFYSQVGCMGNKTYARGTYADYCHYDDEEDQYFKFYFTESDCSDMVKRIYSDCNCLFLESEVDYTTFSECQEASYGAASSRRGFCSTGSSDIPSQMAGTLLSYYDDQICEEAPLDYELFATNICVDLSFLSPNSSLRSEYQTCSNSVVETKVYTSSNCSAASYNETRSSSTYSCLEVTDTDTDQSRYSSKSCVEGPPQGTNGYVFTQFYDDKDCKGTKTYANGYYADFCYSVGSGFYKYSFSAEDCSDLVRLEFSDSSCSVLVDDESFSSFAACSNSADSYPATESFKGFCTLNSTIPIPMDGALMSYFYDSQCGTASYFELVATGVCLDLTVDDAPVDSEYLNCSDSTLTIRSYSDEGKCSSADRTSSSSFSTYDCSSSNGDYGLDFSSSIISSKLRSVHSRTAATTLSTTSYTALTCETSAPRGTDGYYYEQYYDRSGCSGNRTYARGYFGDFCFSSGGSYYKYNFTDGDCGDLQQLLYSDYNCFFYQFSQPISAGLNCTDYEYSFPAAASARRFCSYGRVIPAQMAGTLYSYYSDGSCDTVREYTLLATNLCLDLTNYGSSEGASEFRTCIAIESSITSFPNDNCSISSNDTYVTEETYYCDLRYSDDYTSYGLTTEGTAAVTTTARALRHTSSIISSSEEPIESSDDSFYSSVSCEAGPPAGAVGYVFTQYYSADSCGGDKTFVNGMYGDYCYSGGDDGETYFKYFFTQDNCSDLTQRFYSDSDCSIYLLEERIDHFTDCQTNEDPSAYRSQSSFRGFCSLGVPFPIPMDSIVKSYSHDRDCLTKTYYELRALDLCLDCTNDTSHSPSSEYAICGNYSASVVFGYNITVQSYSDTSVCDPYGLTTVDISEAYACMELLQSPLPTKTRRDYSSSWRGLQSGLFDYDLVSSVWYSQTSDTNGVYSSHYCAVGSPVGTPGYIYEQFYDAVNCSGHKDFSQGRYADFCFSEGTHYYKYQFSYSDCSDLKKLLYADSNCLRFLSFEYMPYYTQCINTINNINDSSYPAAFASFQGFCSLGSDVPVPMNGFLESIYASGDCDTTIMYQIFATDLCLDLTTTDAPPFSVYATCKGQGSDSSSSSIEVTQFNDSSCSSRVGNYSSVATYYCDLTSTDDSDDYYYYSYDGKQAGSSSSSSNYQQFKGDFSSMRARLLAGGLQGYGEHRSDYTSLYCVNEAQQGTDGFIYYQYFTSTNCGGSISVVDGYYADYCAPDDSGLFYKYSFSQSDCSDLLLLSYSDGDCLLLTNTTKVITTYQQSQCQNIDDPSYPAATSFQAVCSPGSIDIPVPMDSYVEGLYDSDDCSVPYQYALIATDLCLNFSTPGDASSVYGSCDGAGTYSEYNITAKSFDSDVCAASTLNGTRCYSSKVCDESEYDDDYYNYGYYSDGKMYSTAFGQLLVRITKDRLRHEKQKQYSRSVVPISSATAGIAGASSSSTRYSKYCLMANRAPSSTPSSRPSYGYGSPTPAPTKFKGVKFSASQTLKGITLSEYQLSQSAYEGILGKAIANSMKSDLITSSNINSLQAAAGSRRLDGSSDSDIYVLIRRRLTTSSSIALTYTVLTQSSSLTYEGLSSQLKSSVSSGYFNTQLQSIASGEGYNTLAQCTSSSVSTVDETPAYDDDSTSQNDDGDFSSLSDGARAGIVIGSVLGGVLLGLCVYYYTQMGSKLSSSVSTPALVQKAEPEAPSAPLSETLQETQNPLATTRTSAARSDVHFGRISEISAMEPLDEEKQSEKLSVFRMSTFGPTEHAPQDRYSLSDGHVDL